ncbi:MAG: hypothetical protein C0602_10890 [Denitrovibrio sp.]|nr:MAG: hypothetical protein C0602_10890 [Denitrovibrio sp.]
MHSISYDIFFVMMGYLIFSMIFILMYFIEKKEYLMLWGLSWFSFAVVISIRILNKAGLMELNIPFFSMTLTFLSTWLLLLGSMMFIRSSRIKKANIALGFTYAAIALMYLIFPNPQILIYFTFAISSVVFIYSGVILYIYAGKHTVGGKIAGVTLFIWGLHKADYPIVKNIEWLLPFGYQISTIFTMLTACGIILMHFEKSKQENSSRNNFFRNIAETSKDIVFFVDINPELTLQYISPSVEKITGYSMQEVMDNASLQNLIIIDFLTKELSGIKQHVKPYELMDVQEIVAKSGKKVLLKFSYTPYHAVDGSIDRVVGYAKDITEDVLDFETLMDRQDWYEALFQKSYNMQMLVKGSTGVIVDANKYLTEFLGYNIADFRTMKLEEIFASQQELNSLWQSTDKVTAPDRYVIKDISGSIKNVLISTSSIEFSSEKYLYLNFTDLSSEIYFEKELNNITTLHSAILESMNEGVAGLDKTGKIFFMNSFAMKLLGYEYDEIVGKDHHNTIHYKNHEGELSREDCPITLAVENEGKLDSHRDSFVKKSGEIVPVEISLGQLSYFNDEKKCIIIFRDITDELENESRMIQQISENKVLLQEVHHRVKNNLQIISSLLSLQTSYMAPDIEKDPMQDSIARIKSMALIHELLYQTNGLSSLSLKHYLDKLVFDLYSMMAISDDVNIKTDIEDIAISLDYAVPCGLIVTELFTNALKHAFKDKPEKKEIEIGFRSDDETSKLWVKDSGVGMKETNTSGKETFGVTVIKSLVKQLGGNITYENQNGLLVNIVFDKIKLKA